MTPRVVFDSNVIFSAIGWRGTPRDCLNLARTWVVQGLVCQHILDEVLEKLMTKLHKNIDEASQIVDELLAFIEMVETMGTLHGICADPDDDEVIECAVVGRARYLVVTGDVKHLLPMREFQGIRIVSPVEFVQIVASIQQEPRDV